MDYAGLDYRNIRYPINRALSEEERANHLEQKKEAGQKPNDGLLVIKFNSNYIELTDRWYPVKGFNVWLGLMFSAISIFLLYVVISGILLSPSYPGEEWIDWIALPILSSIIIIFLYGSVWLVRTEAFRWTHYPIRLNRNTRQVHVFRQDGTVLTTPWDKLFIVLANFTMPPLGKTHDVRAHVLAEDGITVKESFTLGYAYMGNADSNLRLWAFIRRYMEAPDGVQKTFEHMEETFCLPIDGRKEGWGWSILRTFMTAINYPIVQLIFSVPYALSAVGRCIAMSTSKQPHWPAEIEAANLVDADDPYVRTWRNNPKLTAFQVWWPAICFIFGVSILAAIILALGSSS